MTKAQTFEERLQKVLADRSGRAAIAAAVEGALFVMKGSTSRGTIKGAKGRRSKQKGRAGVATVQAIILEMLPFLSADDVFIKTTSHAGADIHFSPKAQSVFNYAVEVKNSEGLNIWKALKQAEANGLKLKQPYILFFKRANTETFVALPAREFLRMMPGRLGDEVVLEPILGSARE